MDIPMARAGGLEGIWPDGKHGREEDVKKYIEIVKSHPEIPDWERCLDELRNELKKIQSRPNEAGWEEWREQDSLPLTRSTIKRKRPYPICFEKCGRVPPADA